MKIKKPIVTNLDLMALLLFFGLSAVGVSAQTVTGTVSDSDAPLPGASVVVKGTTRGVSTDFDGNYSIEAGPEDTLVFSYIGYEAQEIVVGTQTQVTVILQAGNELDEVVVIGYGTTTKKDLTGSVSSVSSEDITQVPASRVDQVLQGRAAGVQVTQSSGSPGAGTAIRVRGGNSITGSNEPLFVIDGIVVGTNFNLNNINPSDIQSIEILKDASSIAIYGSRGANGVVLVTTKSGRGTGTGKPEVSVNVFTSMQMMPELPDVLTREEQIAFTNEHAAFRGVALPFPDDPSTYPDNDWVDLTTGSAPIYNADVSISGSSENVNYYNSINYFNQEGIVKSSGIEKFIFRSNLDINLSDKLKAGFRINYSRLKSNRALTSFGGNLFGTLRTQPAFNDDGTFNGFNDVVGSPFSNPLANFELNSGGTFTNNLLGTVYLEYKPAPAWTIRSTFSPEFNNVKRNIFNSSQLPGNLAIGVTDGGNASVRTVAGVGWNNENTIQYNTDFGEHSLTVLGGASFQKVETEITEAEAFGITSDATGFNSLGNSDPIRSIVSSDYEGFQIASFFGRINYDYKDKYLLTLVGRTDGSSVFAPGNKYEFYPSVAAAWNISEEEFMQDQSLFSNLKLRASWGKSGNQAIGPYRTLGVLTDANTTLNGAEVPGRTLGRPSNPNLQWETTTSLDIALEASLFGGRLFTEFNYYQKETNDLLLDVTIPRQTGFTSQLQNVGALENKGWELLVNSTNISNDNFNWNTTLTLAQNKNEILDLGGQEFIDLVVDPIIGSGNTRLIVGESVPVFTGVNYLGTWKSQAEIDASGLTSQTVGGPRFEDLNGDGIISTEDNVVLGSPFPDLIFGFENSFSYKNLDFSFFFQGTTGNEVFNLNIRNNYFNRGETVKFGDLRNRWTVDNPTSDIPRAGGDSVTNTPINSEYVEDGSHIRLKAVRLAYNFPIDKMGLDGVKNATIYLNGSNLLLFSKTRLIEPEANAFNEGNNQFGNIALGFLSAQYPNPRIITLGLNLTF